MSFQEARAGHVRDILASRDAVLTDSHFVYTSGKHGSAYINKDAIYPYTRDTEELCQMMATDYKNDGIDIVVGPAYGGIILSNNTARSLTALTGREVLGVFAEKEGDVFALKRGYKELVVARRILVVEDILNTGGSVRKVVEMCQELGEVVGVAAIANRGRVTPEHIGHVPLKTLIDVQMEAVDADKCQLCVAQIPVNIRIGKGAEFMGSRMAQ